MCHRRGRISPAFVYHCVRQQLGGTEEIFLHHFTLRQRDGADPGRRPRTSTSAEPKRTVAKLTFFWVAFWNNGYRSLFHSIPICPDLFLQTSHQRGPLATFQIYKVLKPSNLGDENYDIKPGVTTPV